MVTILGKTYGSDLTEQLFGVKNLYDTAKAVGTVGSALSKGNIAGVSDVRPDTQPTTTTPTVPTSNTGGTGGTGGNTGVDTSALNQRIEESKKASTKAAGTDKDALRAEIDAEFNDIMSSLAEQELGVTNQSNLAIQGITNQGSQLESDIANQQAMQLSDIAGQETEARTGSKNAMNTARQTYNEMLSGAQRFAGSGAEAFGGLLGRATAQTIGNAATGLQQTLAKLGGEKIRLNEFYNQKIISVKQNVQLAIQKAQEDLRSEIAKINNARRKANDWKAAERLNSLSKFQATVAQITDAANSAKNALDMWAAERQDIINQNASAEAKANKFGLPEIGQVASALAQGNQGLTAGGYQNLTGYLGQDINSIPWGDIINPGNLQGIGGGSALDQLLGKNQ